MKTVRSIRVMLIACAASVTAASAGVIYVDVNSTTPSAPYTNWATAATVIQDAVDAASAGDEIVVTNGVYQTGVRAVGSLSNRVAVTKPLTVRSVNGPDVTVIRGYQVPGTTNGYGAVRCVYLTNGATLVGFTLTNGHASGFGGGVWCESERTTVSNCVVVGNSADWGGGAFWGTLDGCRLSMNVARSGGGGAVRSILNRCVLMNNSAEQGGAAFNASLNQCTIADNAAVFGGGVCQSALNRCSISGNNAMGVGSYIGIGGGAVTAVLTNCLVFGNIAQSGGGAGNSILWNCTIVGNTAAIAGGGVWAVDDSSGALPVHFDADGCGPFPECELERNHEDHSLLVNCIVYDNTAPRGANHVGFTGWRIMSDGSVFIGETLNYSCTTPMPTNGVGNITNSPLFVDLTTANFRLQSNSPCINAGRNTYSIGDVDLDGNPRIVGGTVDIGAYEFQSPQSTISYAWLQQYGLPTDGSADFADPDGDGCNNWQEWRAWTDPTNSASLLCLLTPTVTTNGLLVRWQSVSGQNYVLERSTDLGTPPSFVPIASNIVGHASITVHTDTNVTGLRQLFYRVSR